MEPLTLAAQWLNEFFAGFDQSIFAFAYSLHEGALGSFFDWFFPNITIFGEAIPLIIIGVSLCLFKKTRKAGFAVLVAIIIGALITNLAIKPTIARPRPYIDTTGIYYQWWMEIGYGTESEFSFPSGHTTACFAAMTTVFLNGNKKGSWMALVLAATVGFSRIYLYVHYPSDVLAGILVGVLAGTCAYFVVKAAAGKIRERENKSAIVFREFNLIPFRVRDKKPEA